MLSPQASVSILFNIARLLEKVMSIDKRCVVCGAWFFSGAMCAQLLIQFMCIDRFETCHCLQILQLHKWFIYNI